MSTPTWSLIFELITPVLNEIARTEDSLTRTTRMTAKSMADAKYAADL